MYHVIIMLSAPACQVTSSFAYLSPYRRRKRKYQHTTVTGEINQCDISSSQNFFPSAVEKDRTEIKSEGKNKYFQHLVGIG